jgi:zinc protease
MVRVTGLDIRFHKHTLANGLDVIVHEDHRVPIVAVNLWYRVGSKNERPGRTGFAHLFEHLMFEGSAHHDASYFRPLQEAGGLLNGSTSTDRTNYWEVVPTSAIDLALWLESDRMGYLLPALTRERFETQRSVVLNERRQTYENRPYGLASMAICAAMYPPDHPYHWMTIGAAEDLRAMRFEDVQAFFRTYYHPANASLVLAGDIAPDPGFDLAERYFGEVAPGPIPAQPRAAADLDAEHRLLLEDRVELPRLYLAWHSPPLFAPGDADLDLLADLLAAGKTSRLYRRLVYEERAAVDVAAFQQSRELGSAFMVASTAAPGRTLSEVGALLEQEIARMASEGPLAPEMERVVAQAEAQFVYRLQTVGGRADQLNAYNVTCGDPGYFAADLDRYRQATAATVQRAAGRFLRPDRRVSLSVVPQGRAGLAIPDSTVVSVS